MSTFFTFFYFGRFCCINSPKILFTIASKQTSSISLLISPKKRSTGSGFVYTLTQSAYPGNCYLAYVNRVVQSKSCQIDLKNGLLLIKYLLLNNK